MVGQGAAARAGAAVAVIEQDRIEHERKGEQPRGDGFDQPRDGNRPDSDELLEGMLMLAAATYEQRKVVHIAHLYDGLLSDESVSAEKGHYLLKLADRLTYRQLVALAVLADKRNQDALATASYRRDEGAVGPADSV